jgi:hypothetical protein
MKTRRCVPLTTFLLVASLLIPSFVLASGVTWTNQTTGTSASGLGWSSITSSSGGDKLAAVADGGDIWTSTTTGATWTNRRGS